LLVVGGGYIGCELGSVYAALGTKGHPWSRWRPTLVPGADRDLANVLVRRLEKSVPQDHGENQGGGACRTRASKIEVQFEGLHVEQPVQRI
jgi:dihydrolipoamide dehydrogenase